MFLGLVRLILSFEVYFTPQLRKSELPTFSAPAPSNGSRRFPSQSPHLSPAQLNQCALPASTKAARTISCACLGWQQSGEFQGETVHTQDAFPWGGGWDLAELPPVEVSQHLPGEPCSDPRSRPPDRPRGQAGSHPSAPQRNVSVSITPACLGGGGGGGQHVVAGPVGQA